jgi:flagellar basal body-associated protein FliL
LLDILSFLPWDVITNATTALLSGQTPIPADQLINQVDSNGSLATTGTVGAIGAIGTLVYKFVSDRKSDLDTVSKGSVTDKMIFNEVIENLGYFVQYLEIERQIDLLEKKNPTMTRAQIKGMLYDENTEETIGVHRARFMNTIIDTFHKYYGTTLGTTEINNFTNDPKKILNQTLSLVKDKTGN